MFLSSLGFQTYAQSTWTGANSSNWNDDGNWNPSGVPGSGDDVIINSGTVNINTTPNAVIGSLTMNGGTLDLFGGLSLTINGSSNVESGATLETRGSLILNDNLTVEGLLELTGGDGISGPGNLTINGNFNWSGGKVGVFGQFVNTGTIGITSAQLETTLDNQGTVALNGNLVVRGNGKYINNGIHDFQGNGDIDGDGANLGVTNNGSIIKSGGTSRSDIVDVVYDGSGSVEAQIGTIDFRGNSTQSGTLISSGGQIRFPTSTHSFSGASIQGAGATEVNGGTVNIDSDVSATNLILSGGNIQGTGDLTISNSMTWTGGQIGNSVDQGQVIVSNDFAIDGINGKFLGTTLINNGTAIWTDGNWFLLAGAKLINENSFDVQTNRDMDGSSLTIENNGIWTKTAGTSTTFMNPILTNNGLLSVETGTLQLFSGVNTGTMTVNAGATMEFSGSNAFTNEIGGTIGGSGTVSIDNMVNNGSFAPGASPGILNIDAGAGLVMSPTSTIDMEIGGTTVGTGYDQINFTGNFVLDGAMNISFINGFVPSPSNSFTLFTSSSHTGQFANINVEQVDGLLLNVNNAGSIISMGAVSLYDYHVESISFGEITLENPQILNLIPDKSSDPIPLGFEFNFFGQVQREVRITQNGFLTFDDDNSSPQQLPSVGTPNNVIAGFWSGLTQQPSGVIQYSLNGSSPDRVFVVEYEDMLRNDGNGTVSMQMHLFETSSKIEVHCKDCQEGSSDNTQGIENGDGTKAFFINGRNSQEFGLANDGVSFTPFAATPISQTEVVLSFPPLVILGKIRRSTDGENFTEIASNISLGTASFTDTVLDPFTEYNYELTGAFGPGEPSSTIYYLSVKTLPDPFTNLIEVSTSNTSVNLNWTDNTLGFDEIILERATSPEGSFELLTPEELERPLSDGNLDPGVTYYYRLGAATSFGHAAFSNVLTVTTSQPNKFFVNQNATGANNGSSWTDAYIDLTDALDEVSDKDEIWVAAGIYKPGGTSPDTGSSFELQSNVKLYGGFAGNEATLEERDLETNVTILSGDIGVEGNSVDNVNVVVKIDSDTDYIIDGFTIKGGLGGNSGNGAGIYTSDANVAISNTIITENTASSKGGGIYKEGEGRLKIIDSEIGDNSSLEGGGIYINEDGVDVILTTELAGVTMTDNIGNTSGGGIYFNSEYGTLKIVDSNISNNNFPTQEDGDGGGIYVEAGKLSIDQSEINDNSANNHGGGIYVVNLLNLRIENTQINGNQAGLENTGSRGGGIYIDNFAFDESPFVMINSTVSNNTAPNNGGGLFTSSKEHDIINTTFSGNSSTNGSGGGIYFDFETVGSEPEARLNHVTLTNNFASLSGGGIFNSETNVSITNVLLASNSDGLSSPDFGGNLISGGYNIVGDLGGSSFNSNTTGDKYGDTQNTTTENTGAMEFATVIDPLIDVLASNFGTTQTHALLVGSPAIDMGTAFDFDGETLNVDQRGFSYSNAPDIGAFEFISNFAPVLDNSTDLQFTDLDEDMNDPSGDLLSDLEIAITDIDGLNEGIAVIGVDNADGNWQFSLDGTAWTDFDSPTISTARLLLRDENTRIRFIPAANFNGTIDDGITFHAWDQSESAVGEVFDASITGGNSSFSIASETVSITINPINDAPVLTTPITNLQTNEDEAFNLNVVNTFEEVDAGDVITLTATLADDTALPSWLTFDGTTFSGLPSNEDVALLGMKVIATDNQGATAIDEFELEVVNINDAPMVINPISNQEALQGEAYDFTIPENTFDDIDAGDILSLTALLDNDSPLPAWLMFDELTLRISGTPASTDVGSINIRIVATDQQGASTSTSYELNVNSITGISEVNLEANFTVFPNPNRGEFTISVLNEFNHTLDLMVVNTVGQIVFSDKVTQQSTYTRTVDFIEFPNGIYQIIVRTKDKVASRLFLKR